MAPPAPSPVPFEKENGYTSSRSPSRQLSPLTQQHSPHSPVVVAQAQSSVSTPVRGGSLNSETAAHHQHQVPRNLCLDTSARRRLSPASYQNMASSCVSAQTNLTMKETRLPKFQFRGDPRERLYCESEVAREKLEKLECSGEVYSGRVFKSEDTKQQQWLEPSKAFSGRSLSRQMRLESKRLPSVMEVCNDGKVHKEEVWADMDRSSATYLSEEQFQDVEYLNVKSEMNAKNCYGSPPPPPPPPVPELQEPTLKLDSTQYTTIDYSSSQYCSPPYSSSNHEASPPPSPHNEDGSHHPLSPDSTQHRVQFQPPAPHNHHHRHHHEHLQQHQHQEQQQRLVYAAATSSSVTRPYDPQQDMSSTVINSSTAPSLCSSTNSTEFLAPRSPPPLPSSSSTSMTPSSSTERAASSPSPEKTSGNLYAVIDKIIIEFDGTTLLCRVCGDRSSGFHYGVHSCEGCKGFFRRSIQQKIQYRPCSKNQQCLVQKTNRNRCQYCRLKKCIEVGMSKDAVRFGRVPKNEKERIRQAMEKANINGSQPPEVSDDYLVQSITNSHLRSCVVSNESVKHIISIAESSPHSPPLGFNPVSNCPLNPYVAGEDFHQKFSPIVREVVGFAKNIPGFTEVRHEDKITLLRACVFEVLLIRFATLVDAKNRRIITITGFIIGASIYASHKPSNDFVNTLFTFVERISSLSLVDEEMALFTAAIVINPKREGLLDLPKIACIHKRIVNCLQLVMQRERPNDPNACQALLSTLNDLWILNGMHSKQTQAKHKGGEISMNGHQTESLNSQYQSAYSTYPESQTCPIRYASSSSSPEYDDKRMTIDEGSPTSPTSTFSPDEEMRSPGSADSGCSTDSGCSIESGCSSDSGCSLTSHTTEHRAPALLSEDHREVISSPDDESSDTIRKCHIKRKANMSSEETRMDSEKSRSLQWHKPQKDAEKSADSPVLRMCLEAPSTLKMETFTDYYRGNVTSHHHKKFRSTLALQEKAAQSQETLDSTSSSLPSCTPSPSYSLSPSPSSSLGSSPARMSSFSPCSSSSSSNTHSLASTSILAHRLALPIGSFPQTSRLIQSLTQESSIGKNKVQMVCDALHDSIMSDESKVRCPHVMAAPSPSRYDELRNSSPMHVSHMSPHHSIATSPPPHHISSLHNSPHHSSPPHSFSSPPLSSSHLIPPAHSPPQSYGSGIAMSEFEAQPLNLSTKTPSPPPFMEG